MNGKKRKLIWSAPIMAALAAVGALAILVALAPHPAQAHDPPGPVANLTGEVKDVTRIELSWDAPTTGGAPTGYRIDRSADGDVWKTHVDEADQTKRTYPDTGLDAATEYYYRVFAVNSAGVGPVSQDYVVTTDEITAATSEPLNLRAQAVGRNQVNLTWKPPAKLNGGKVISYEIQFTDDADWPEKVDGDGGVPVPGVIPNVPASDGTAYQHMELDAGTPYRYRVRAINNNDPADESAWSNIAGATTEPLGKPSPPTNVRVVEITDQALNVYWHAPTELGGFDLADVTYEVQVQKDGAGDYETVPWTKDETETGDLAAYTHDSKPTRFRVIAITQDGMKSDPSEPSRIAKPINVEAERLKNIPGNGFLQSATRDPMGNVVLTWNAPGDTGDDGYVPFISEYSIDVSDDAIHWRPLVDRVAHIGRGLERYEYVDEERKDRYYRIFAWYGQTMGPSSGAPKKSELQPAAPPAPGHVLKFTAQGVGPTQIDLAWDPPANDGGAPIAGYRIDAIREDDAGKFPDDPFPTSGEFQVEGSSSALPKGEPGDAEGKLIAVFTETTGYQHEKLNAGEEWQYRVLAVNDTSAAGSGRYRMDPTGAENRKATTRQADVPMAPEGLTAEDASGGVLLLWNAPNPPAGVDDIDGYRIGRMKGDADWETLVANTGKTDTDYTDPTKPAADEMRMYRVAALNGDDVGAYATVSYPHPGHSHVAAAVTAIAAQTATAGAPLVVDVAAGFTGDAPLTYTAESDMPDIATVSVEGSEVTVTGVAPGTATITVTATDAAGETATQTFEVTITAAAAAALTAPTNLMAEVADTDSDAPNIVVTWTDGENAEGYLVFLFDTSDWSLAKAAKFVANDIETATFTNVAPGAYVAVVVAYDAAGNIELEIGDTITVGGG